MLVRGQVRLNCERTESNLMTNDPALQYDYAPVIHLHSLAPFYIILLGITIQQLIYYSEPDRII